MLNCPKCFNKEATQLIACDIAKDVVCNLCHPDHNRKKDSLGVIVKDKYGMTLGQISNIESRVIGKDNKVVNRVTGKPARL